MSLKAEALKTAITQVGVEEKPKGSNSGKEVNEYLKSVGLNPGFSWCAAFVYWCFNKAALGLKISNPLIKTGGVLAHWNQADKKYRVTTSPEPGDIFIMDFSKGLGHTGIVESVTASHINTIEGNASDNNGGREGYIVTKKSRAKTSIKGYLRYA
jgi:hypothetical protein